MRLIRSVIGACAVVGVLGLVGCTPSNVPESYDGVVKTNFINTCTANIPAVEGTTTTLASSAYCECAYLIFYNNVPYNAQDQKDRDGGKKFEGYSGKTFLEYNNELKENANALPASVTDLLKTCPAGTEKVTVGTTPGSVPGTTVGPTAATEVPTTKP